MTLREPLPQRQTDDRIDLRSIRTATARPRTSNVAASARRAHDGGVSGVREDTIPPPAPSELRVLLVDDDRLDLARARHFLQSDHSANYRVAEASSIREAMQTLLQWLPHCVIASMRLPDGSGLDLLRAVSTLSEAQRCPVILMTGYEDRAVGLATMKAGASDFIAKAALTAESIQRSVCYAIEKHKSEQQRRRLAVSERMTAIGQLAAGVIHEVNNPAAFVLANLEALEPLLEELRGDSQTPRQKGALREASRIVGECCEGIARVGSVINELRLFANLNPQRVQRVCLEEVISEARESVARSSFSRTAVEISTGGRLEVQADRAKLAKVLGHLLMNAADAAQHKPAPLVRVTASCLSGDGTAQVDVEDNGDGVPLALRERIFEPFFSTKGELMGSGLGLALSAEYVQRHGGSISVGDSNLGGALFRVTLPLHFALPDNGLQRPTPATPLRRSHARAKVLLIDDEPNILRAFTRVLRPHHDVTAVASAPAALDRLNQQWFDAVVCDVSMPGMDGIALYEAVHNQAPEQARRFLFCSGGGLSEQAQCFVESSQAVLRKPVSTMSLLAAIESVVS